MMMLLLHLRWRFDEDWGGGGRGGWFRITTTLIL